ncbi:MAG: hypothetical protein M1830_006029 [Pleopsidium flavum]|nr:MAG: hypothetical protein M1830_006029 [Pleopsidium flavum]
MTPSENTGNELHSSTDVPEANANPSTTTESATTSKRNEETKAPNETNGVTKRTPEVKEEKLSGAEIKKRAKAEKAARRAQVKQETQQPDKGNTPEQIKPAVAVNARKDASRVAPGVPSATPTPNLKGQHKRTGSMSATSQKAIPLRPTQSQVILPSLEQQKESKKVALFGHLYGHPRRTTLAGAGKDVHPAVLALGLQMSNYVVCGSNARCIATLLVFKRVIESYTTPPQNSLTRHLTSHLSPQIDYLVSCRPLSVSMGNAIRWLKLEISKIDPDTPEAKAKADLCEGVDNFIRERITVADQVIATSAAEKIRDGDVILTFAKSSIVQQTLVEAQRRGTTFRVIVIDSRPLFEGKNLARALADLGLEVQYSLTHAISHAMKDATKVFLGAHAMMSNGRLYSRVGTAIVAMMASEVDVPVIVCCESVKFTDKVALDSIVTNEVAPPDELIPADKSQSPLFKWRDAPNLQLLNIMYDVTPAEYIKMVITEYGSLPPSSVPVVHRISTNT